MADLLFVVITIAFFILCVGYVQLCDRIIGPDPRQPAEFGPDLFVDAVPEVSGLRQAPILAGFSQVSLPHSGFFRSQILLVRIFGGPLKGRSSREIPDAFDVAIDSFDSRRGDGHDCGEQHRRLTEDLRRHHGSCAGETSIYFSEESQKRSSSGMSIRKKRPADHADAFRAP